MPKRIAVLECSTWKWSLLPQILGEEALRVPIDPFKPLPNEDFERICETADVVCFHLPLSIWGELPLGIPGLARRFNERGLQVVNGSVKDSRKRSLHRHLRDIGLLSAEAERDGLPEEQLLIKTNLNHGGKSEKDVDAEVLAQTGIPRFVSASLRADTYRSVKRREVSDADWADPSLVIERQICNPEGTFYRIYFCGRQIIIVHAYASGLIKKLSADPRDTNYASEMDYMLDDSDGLAISGRLKRDVATFVKCSPIDYGCLDIVHDGRDNHYVVDLNLTPSGSEQPADPQLHEFLMHGIVTPSQRKPLPERETALG